MAVSSAYEESVAHICRASLFDPFVFMVCFALSGWGSTHATAPIADDHRPVLVGCEDPYSPSHRKWDEPIGEDKIDIAIAHDALDCIRGQRIATVGVAAAGRVTLDRMKIRNDPDMGPVPMLGLRIEIRTEDRDDRISPLQCC